MGVFTRGRFAVGASRRFAPTGGLPLTFLGPMRYYKQEETMVKLLTGSQGCARIAFDYMERVRPTGQGKVCRLKGQGSFKDCEAIAREILPEACSFYPGGPHQVRTVRDGEPPTVPLGEPLCCPPW